VTLLHFPHGFLWGTATSSHQVEGDDANTDWWAFERVPGNIHDGSNADRACEWWRGRAEEDLDRAAELGTNAIRISLSWARLEPEDGRFDHASFDRYRQLLAHARARGLSPCVTLHHFTLPRWLVRDGGLLGKKLVPRFARFCARAGTELGAHVERWVTINEPNVLAFMSYFGKAWPPARGSAIDGGRALVALARMHAAGYGALKEATPETPVGLVLNVPDFVAARDNAVDRAAAKAQDAAFTGWWLSALRDGWLRPPLAMPPRHVARFAKSSDFLGVNYYGRYRVRFDPRSGATLFGRAETDRSIRTAHNDWGDVAPDGLTRQLRRVHHALGVPLVVTENGVMDAEDSLRRSYLVSHVRAVHEAIAKGADVRGYFVWSLLDNFEWAEGFEARFGLFALDPLTQIRTKRPSADLYAEICRHNGVTT